MCTHALYPVSVRLLILLSGISLLLLCDATAIVAQNRSVARADNPPVWGANPQLVEEIRIGILDGDDRYILGRVDGIAVTADGSIWVADGQRQAIRRYAPNGTHLGDVGRRGEGPGEFSSIAGFRLLPDGTMAVWDVTLRRISRFAADGAFLGSMTVPVAAAVGGGKTFETDPDGNFYISTAYALPDLPPRFRAFWLLLNPRGEIADTLERVSPSLDTLVSGEAEGLVHPIRSVSTVSSQGYFVAGRNHEYAFHRSLPDGRILTIQRSWAPVQYQGIERVEAQALENHFAARWADRQPRRIPQQKPVWVSFDIDIQGRLWVQRYAAGFFLPETPEERQRREGPNNPPREWRQPLVYDVIEPQGRYVGTVRFPGHTNFDYRSGIPHFFARDNFVWAVQRGEYDEEYVIRYRVESRN